MQSMLMRISVALSAAAFLLILAAGASAATLRGVVVHDNSRAHSFVVAGSGGLLTAVHARALPRVGREVTVRARQLRNGTWLAQRVSVGHSTSRVVMRGTVTYVAAGRNSFVLSARGASLLVRRSGARLHGVRLAADSSIAVGNIVTVDGSLDSDSVAALQVQHDGQNPNGINLEGIIQAVNTTTRTVDVSADDSDQSGATVTVQVPASFDLALFQVGQSAELIVSPNPDGTYTLEESSDDSGGRHADNPGEIQGDGHGDQHASAEQQCVAQASDPNFPGTHNGVSFTQFYEIDPSGANDAFGRCVDAMAHGDGGRGSGSGGSGSEPFGSGSGGAGSNGPGSGAAASSGPGSGGSGSGSAASEGSRSGSHSHR